MPGPTVTRTNEDTIKQMQALIAQENKTAGEGTMSLAIDLNDIECVSSGSLNLDLALGGNGFPVGRLIEIYGPESGGKTTIALLHAAEMQKRYPDKYILFMDLERALAPALLAAYGIDEKRFIVSIPKNAEESLNILQRMAQSGLLSLAIVDSVAALVPEYEATEDYEKSTIGLQARLISKMCRKLGAALAVSKTSIVFLNQIREKVGVMYGNPETTPGGRALAFYASVRLEVRPGEKLEDPRTKEIVGHVVKARVKKNKVAMPHKVAEFPLYYGVGVDRASEVADVAIGTSLFLKAGSWLRVVDSDGKPLVRVLDDAAAAVLGNATVPLNFQSKDKLLAHIRADESFYRLLEHFVRTGEVPSEEQWKGMV